MTVRKELVVHVETNEEGEFVKINKLDGDGGFFLLTFGANRMVVNGDELIEAINSIGFYSTLFTEETRRRQQSKSVIPTVVPVAAPKKAGKKKVDEEEGAIVLEPVLRLGPTASELALEAQTKHMKGETIVLTEKK